MRRTQPSQQHLEVGCVERNQACNISKLDVSSVTKPATSRSGMCRAQPNQQQQHLEVGSQPIQQHLEVGCVECNQHTHLHVNSTICGIYFLCFVARLIMLCTIGRHGTCMCWCVITKKIDSTPSFGVYRINVKLLYDIVPET